MKTAIIISNLTGEVLDEVKASVFRKVDRNVKKAIEDTQMRPEDLWIKEISPLGTYKDFESAVDYLAQERG
jgi:hypothetical protein